MLRLGRRRRVGNSLNSFCRVLSPRHRHPLPLLPPRRHRLLSRPSLPSTPRRRTHPLALHPLLRLPHFARRRPNLSSLIRMTKNSTSPINRSSRSISPLLNTLNNNNTSIRMPLWRSVASPTLIASWNSSLLSSSTSIACPPSMRA